MSAMSRKDYVAVADVLRYRQRQEAPAEPEPLDTRPEEWRDEDREWRQKASD